MSPKCMKVALKYDLQLIMHVVGPISQCYVFMDARVKCLVD